MTVRVLKLAGNASKLPADYCTRKPEFTYRRERSAKEDIAFYLSVLRIYGVSLRILEGTITAIKSFSNNRAC